MVKSKYDKLFGFTTFLLDDDEEESAYLNLVDQFFDENIRMRR